MSTRLRCPYCGSENLNTLEIIQAIADTDGIFVIEEDQVEPKFTGSMDILGDTSETQGWLCADCEEFDDLTGWEDRLRAGIARKNRTA